MALDDCIDAVEIQNGRTSISPEELFNCVYQINPRMQMGMSADPRIDAEAIQKEIQLRNNVHEQVSVTVHSETTKTFSVQPNISNGTKTHEENILFLHQEGQPTYVIRRMQQYEPESSPVRIAHNHALIDLSLDNYKAVITNEPIDDDPFLIPEPNLLVGLEITYEELKIPRITPEYSLLSVDDEAKTAYMIRKFLPEATMGYDTYLSTLHRLGISDNKDRQIEHYYAGPESTGTVDTDFFFYFGSDEIFRAEDTIHFYNEIKNNTEATQREFKNHIQTSIESQKTYSRLFQQILPKGFSFFDTFYEPLVR